MKGILPPLVVQSSAAERLLDENQWRRAKKKDGKYKEAEYEYLIRLLSKSDYDFMLLAKLGAGRGSEKAVKSIVRDLLATYLSLYAHSLDEGGGFVHLAAKPMLDFIAPPKLIAYAVIGKGSEPAASLRQKRAQWLRWNFASGFSGFDSVGSATNAYFNLNFSAGPELELNYGRHSPFFQARLLSRIGYQFVFTHNDGEWDNAFSKNACERKAENKGEGQYNSIDYCSGMNLQAAVAFSVFERMRFQFGFEYLPYRPGRFGIDAGDWNWMAEVGWQFLPASKRRVRKR